jgi:flagellar biosynthetic protein FliR
MLQEILTLNIFAFLLIFVRIGTAFMVMPGFGSTDVSRNIKLAFALAVSFSVTPVLAGVLPRIPVTPAGLGILIMGEVLIGAFLGAIGRIMSAALHVAGTVISFVSSMTNAFIHDAIADQQSSTISGFLGTTGMVLIFVTDMHHLMLRAVVESYALFKPGEQLMIGDLLNVIARQFADSFTLGVQLSAPFIVTGTAYYVGLGLLSRLMPALPVFFVGLPLQIAMQLAILMLGLSTMMMIFLSHYEQSYIQFLQ